MPFAAGDISLFHDQQDVVQNSQLAKNTGLLRQVANSQPGALMHGQFSDIAIVEPDFTTGRLLQTNSHIKGGSFASPIRTEQAHYFTLID
jgi:hypothetical protein